MTPAEEGLLLLCCRLEEDWQPLTLSQHKALRKRVQESRRPGDPDRTLEVEDLEAIGCGRTEAERILEILSRQDWLRKREAYWTKRGVEICTRLSGDYPPRLRERLGNDAPAALFLLGDRSLLQRPAIALVGARDLREEGRAFAEAVGRLAARSGHVLVSGNARGADQTAQEACLEAGGAVISVVADRLLRHAIRRNFLYVSEDGPDLPFSAGRALRRNRLIHAMGAMTFAAQIRYGSGGTWSGSLHNLQHGLSTLYVPEDGSPASVELCRRGALPITVTELDQLVCGNNPSKNCRPICVSQEKKPN